MKRIIISFVMCLFILSGCSKPEYQELYENVNDTFDNQPTATVITFEFGDNNFDLYSYENVEKQETYLQIENLKASVVDDVITYTDGDQVYTTPYTLITDQYLDLESDWESDYYTMLSLPKPTTKVTNDFLNEQFDFFRPLENENKRLIDLVYLDQNDVYNIEGQEGIISFSLIDDAFTLTTSLPLGSIISTTTVEDTPRFTINSKKAQEINAVEMYKIASKDFDQLVTKCGNKYDDYLTEHEEEFRQIMKDNKEYVTGYLFDGEEIKNSLSEALSEA